MERSHNGVSSHFLACAPHTIIPEVSRVQRKSTEFNWMERFCSWILWPGPRGGGGGRRNTQCDPCPITPIRYPRFSTVAIYQKSEKYPGYSTDTLTLALANALSNQKPFDTSADRLHFCVCVSEGAKSPFWRQVENLKSRSARRLMSCPIFG